jgi:hypothetical protein
MSNNSSLRARALAAIREGRLSCERPARLWGGTGDGSQCAVCSSPIATNEIGFELRSGDFGGPPRNVHLHCLKAWDDVRQRAKAGGDGLSHNAPSGR